MADTYLSSPTYNTSSTTPSYISDIRAEDQRIQAIRAEIDTIEKSKNQKEDAASGNRPELPHGIAPPNNNYLSALAAAFSSVYGTLTTSTVSQASDLANLQTYDQAMAQASLIAVTNAMKAETTNFNKEQGLDKIIQTDQKVDKAFNDIMKWVGWVLIAVTLASSLLDGGASDVLLPEETEMSTLTPTTSLTGGGESGATELSEEVPKPMNNVVNPDDSEAFTEDYMKQTKDMMTKPSSENSIKTFQRVTSNWDKVKQGLTNKWFQRCVSFGGAAVYGIPKIAEGYAQYVKAEYEKNYVYPAQQALGPAMAQMQRLNIDLQYCQQLVQRQGGVAQTLISQLSDVLQTASSIFSAYRQIPTNLAQAV